MIFALMYRLPSIGHFANEHAASKDNGSEQKITCNIFDGRGYEKGEGKEQREMPMVPFLSRVMGTATGSAYVHLNTLVCSEMISSTASELWCVLHGESENLASC